ncbi:MAG: (2Fe-2S)-binding protein [Methylococcales bacterium]
MYICVCKAVTDKQVKRAIEEGCCSRRQINQCLGIGGVCGKCNRDVSRLLDENQSEQPNMWAAA